VEGGNPRVAVIQFPGVNCEYETRDALAAVGLVSEIVRWNASSQRLEGFEGYVLPGGFSYQDRIRAGVIAAKESVMDVLSREARKGKAVLGICNGCQILVEAGLVPGVRWGHVEVAVAPNRLDGRRGYLATWVHLRPEGRLAGMLRPISGSREAPSIFPLPIAHAEGRFVTRREGLWRDLSGAGQVILRYAPPETHGDDGGTGGGKGAGERVLSGEREAGSGLPFPANPNGSQEDVAGVCNPEGNVLGIMPHPERAFFLRQVPEDLPGTWGGARRRAAGSPEGLGGPGPGAALLAAFANLVRRESGAG
jgi:phosphoribosylformylglycinamidine (FGAM) synthase-like amidotransferase family enzyme